MAHDKFNQNYDLRDSINVNPTLRPTTCSLCGHRMLASCFLHGDYCTRCDGEECIPCAEARKRYEKQRPKKEQP